MHTPSRRSTLTVTLCFVVALIEGLDLQSAGIAAAGIRQTFELDQKMMGWMFSASIIGLLPGAFFGGWLADRIGRKRVLIGAVVIFGIFSLWTAYVGGVNTLMLARFMTGLGLGAALPNLIALCAEAVDEKHRGTAISIMYCGVPLGGAVASVVGMLGGENWQAVFIVGGLAPLLIAPLLIVALPESRDFREQFDGTAPARQSTVQALFGNGRASITVALWVSYFFTLTVMYMLLNWLPSLLLEQGFSKSQAGTVQTLFNIGGAIGSLLGGVLLDRQNRTAVVIICYGGLLASLAALGLVSGLTAMAAAGFSAGLFMLASQLVLYALAPPAYPASIRATGVGAAVAIGRLGSVSGPLAAGQILAAGAGTTGVLLAASPGLVIAALVVLSMSRRAVADHAVPSTSSH